jgi:DNA modification methylase
MIQGNSYTLHIGNNLDILPTLPDNSVDSIVTDPPYELGFMGKKWDSSGIAYSVELWTQCLRVLKPGGHLLSFGGTRTWHRVAVAIEDAGFEVRDSIAWMYGSGFPKSLDVSKAIDKSNGKHQVDLAPFGAYVRELREAKGLSRKQLDDLMGTNTAVSWWEGRASGVQLPSKETYERLKPVLGMDDRFDSLIDWAEAEREVIGKKPSSLGGTVAAGERNQEIIDYHKNKIVDITAPSTPEAKQWEGWGTALKPAFEPIVVARKPLIGTVAENVLTHGTGGLNIDGSRIGTEQIEAGRSNRQAKVGYEGGWKETTDKSFSQGRWPANVILDEYTAELLDEQSGISKSNLRPATGKPHLGKSTSVAQSGGTILDLTDRGHNDSGGASRFFYVAKASKRDRNEGLEDLADTTAGNMVEREEGSAGMNSPRAGAGRTSGAKNFHPTVKPTDLMRYLIKLVTPPGGVVLDPFTGSGSTGKAAILEGFRFIGCELTEDYIPIIEGRLQHAEAMAAEAEAKKDEALF